MKAYMLTCMLDFSTLMQFRTSCPGGGAAHGGLGLNIIKKILHTVPQANPIQTIPKTVFAGDSKLCQVDNEN